MATHCFPWIFQAGLHHGAGQLPTPIRRSPGPLPEVLDSGEELGASIWVNMHGKTVVDLWGGYANLGRTQAWEQDTITNVFSTSKTIFGLVGLMLVERGLVDLHEPVSTYWPEFAANGKEAVKFCHIISHTSGVAGWEDRMTMEDVFDLEKSPAKLAAQKPWWTPGTASGYHSLTMGHLVGEVVRRTTGKSLTQFIQDEIAGPLHADFQLGVCEADLYRVSDIIPFVRPPGDAPLLNPQSVSFKVRTNPAIGFGVANNAGWRKAEIGAANGHSNAAAIGRILSTITCGGALMGCGSYQPIRLKKYFRSSHKE